MSAESFWNEIRFDVTEGAAVLELRRPHKRNAVTRGMWHAILGHLKAAASARFDVKVLVIRGSEGTFCAGADLAEVKQPDGTASASYHALAVEAFTAITEFPMPTLAQIEGPCIGGGLALALACDIRFACPEASFSVPAVRHGIAYDKASAERLVALVGAGRAARLLYTGVRIDGNQAAGIGLVDECSSDLEGLTADAVRAITAADRNALAANRALLRAASRAN